MRRHRRQADTQLWQLHLDMAADAAAQRRPHANHWPAGIGRPGDESVLSRGGGDALPVAPVVSIARPPRTEPSSPLHSLAALGKGETVQEVERES